MLEPLTAWLADHADKLPFIAATANAGPKMSGTRLLEAAIIAAIIAAGGYFFMVPRIVDVIQTDLAYIKRDIAEIKSEVRQSREIERDLQRQIDRRRSKME